MINNSAKPSDLSISGDYEQSLLEAWKSDKQRPIVYSRSVDLTTSPTPTRPAATVNMGMNNYDRF